MKMQERSTCCSQGTNLKYKDEDTFLAKSKRVEKSYIMEMLISKLGVAVLISGILPMIKGDLITKSNSCHAPSISILKYMKYK